MPEQIPGLPSRTEFGDLSKIQQGQLLTLLSQLHTAQKAGVHRDIRIGSPEMGLFSWASRKPLPEVGAKTMLIRQPLHTFEYKDFEGNIPSGYGAGDVQKELERKALVTSVDKDGFTFTIADTRNPEKFRLQRVGANYLLINVTPTEQPPDKQHYKVVRAEDVDKVFTSDNVVQGKIDGASELIKVLGPKMTAISYRTDKSGRPISYTEKSGLYAEEPGSLPSGNSAQGRAVCHARRQNPASAGNQWLAK